MGMLANPFDRGKLRHDGGESGDGQQHPLVDIDLESGVVRIAPAPPRAEPGPAESDPAESDPADADPADAEATD
ncbi:hypothetical protein [Nakamurella lactea]|uniref:hypothetical protein n=1 Tax=Nakamurella lactea TaxID=459515 RepID=UPI0004100024|nr:hypothetical protein [Nakamurella lactea]